MRRLFPVLVAAAMGALSHAAHAQSTAFTYQGELKSGGGLANGLHDLRFKLFDSASGGAQVGSTVCVDNVPVTNGKFTARIDFGSQFANISARHLEVDVRTDTGLDCSIPSDFETLTPRQAITPAPRAVAANTAFSLSAPDGSPQSSLVVDNDGKVGIGTPTPAAPLHLRTAGPFMVLQDTSTNANQAGYLGFWNNSGTETGWMGYGTPGSPHLSVLNARAGGNLSLHAGTGGAVTVPSANVGIGIAAPTAKLDVRGEVRYGSTGQYRPIAGEEPLRTIRGGVRADGTFIFGSGFTVSHPATGEYVITFTTPFTGSPAVTTSGRYENGVTHVMTHGVSTGSVTIWVLSTSNSLRDGEFHFIATGPR